MASNFQDLKMKEEELPNEVPFVWGFFFHKFKSWDLAVGIYDPWEVKDINKRLPTDR